mmetsp:Transcript_20705/g.25625  ORF Transcript_20705/g.25625 Transcript_20705/m.25625 type:complete len:397 (-) Transcript_20705:28-1218(-)
MPAQSLTNPHRQDCTVPNASRTSQYSALAPAAPLPTPQATKTQTRTKEDEDAGSTLVHILNTLRKGHAEAMEKAYREDMEAAEKLKQASNNAGTMTSSTASNNIYPNNNNPKPATEVTLKTDPTKNKRNTNSPSGEGYPSSPSAPSSPRCSSEEISDQSGEEQRPHSISSYTTKPSETSSGSSCRSSLCYGGGRNGQYHHRRGDDDANGNGDSSSVRGRSSSKRGEGSTSSVATRITELYNDSMQCHGRHHDGDGETDDQPSTLDGSSGTNRTDRSCSGTTSSSSSGNESEYDVFEKERCEGSSPLPVRHHHQHEYLRRSYVAAVRGLGPPKKRRRVKLGKFTCENVADHNTRMDAIIRRTGGPSTASVVTAETMVSALSMPKECVDPSGGLPNGK